MANEHDKVGEKVDVIVGSFGIMLVNAVPLWGVTWLWGIGMSWNPNPELVIIPIIVFAILLFEFVGGMLLSHDKVANGQYVYLGKTLAYGAMLSAVVPFFYGVRAFVFHIRNRY